MKIWLLNHLLTAALVAGVAGAQLPLGYQVDSTARPLPDSLREVSGAGRFTISVQRIATTAFDRRLIEVAESLIPPRDSIEESTKRFKGSGWIEGFAAAARLPGKRWWWREWDGVLLPYGLTGGAIVQYIDHVRRLSAGPNPFAAHSQGTQLQASVTYKATVSPLEGSGSYRVELSVDFHVYCGPLCALAFTHSRIVEFDKAGIPLRVRGDGAPRFIVS